MPDIPSGKPQFSWLGKFYVACRGIYWGMQGQTSFYVHLPLTLLSVLLALVFQFDAIRWMILLLAIGLVLTAELLNSAVERVFHGLPEEMKNRCWPALDVAAGAVLIASVVAAIIGLVLFLPPFLAYFR